MAFDYVAADVSVALLMEIVDEISEKRLVIQDAILERKLISSYITLKENTFLAFQSARHAFRGFIFTNLLWNRKIFFVNPGLSDCRKFFHRHKSEQYDFRIQHLLCFRSKIMLEREAIFRIYKYLR